ncbi:cytochrome c [Motiliproteus sp. SC1-56]|uniref:c-type cytochrome n=1 Tax=Motiliproteus sp. SC1-56 TaxID=2799565 RepID=UPI00351C8B9F
MGAAEGGSVIAARSLITGLLLGLFFSGSAFAVDLSNGEKLYQRHCANCHGTDGRGVHPMAPNFRKQQGLLTSDRQLENHIRRGKGGCPSFAGIIKDAHLFDVVTYLRVFR